MEGKRLYFPTQCCEDPTCETHHVAEIEKVENDLVSLFNSHAVKHGVNTKPVIHSGLSTHVQYVDRKGSIHLRSKEDDLAPYSDIVNFRLLKTRRSTVSFPPFETDLGNRIEWYLKHVYKS